jgi:hypothetical protein
VAIPLEEDGARKFFEENFRGRARHPECNEARRRRTRDSESTLISRCKEGVIVSERQLSVALTRHTASPNINAKQEIILAIRSSPTWSYGVAQAGKCSRHDGEPRQRTLGHIDVEWIVRQRFERLDRFELSRQQSALVKVEVTDHLGARGR